MDPRVQAQLAEAAAAEDAALAAVRSRAGPDADLPSPPVGALLAWIAATIAAKHVVEVGSASGLTGLWLLRGLAPRGLITSIERDPRTQSLAMRAYDDAGAGDLVRSILSDPLAVLPRLSDHSYDLCIVQTNGVEYPRYLEHALRLLRPGGVLVVRGVSTGDGGDARGRRILATDVAQDTRLIAAILDLDGGVLLATVLEAE